MTRMAIEMTGRISGIDQEDYDKDEIRLGQRLFYKYRRLRPMGTYRDRSELEYKTKVVLSIPTGMPMLPTKRRRNLRVRNRSRNIPPLLLLMPPSLKKTR